MHKYNSDKGHDWLIGRSRKPFKNSEKKDEDDWWKTHIISLRDYSLFARQRSFICKLGWWTSNAMNGFDPA